MQGRRVSKIASNKISGVWVKVEDRKYIYDGWNVVVETDCSNRLTNSYMWGIDISGSEQGGGGIDGLLCENLGNKGSHWIISDGRGNVIALVGASNACINAEYEYGPFGEVVRMDGDVSRENSFRYSTKYYDNDVNLLYYGYRYYSMNSGRWLTRDPIEEQGGPNLYNFNKNNPLSFVDKRGLQIAELIDPAIGGISGAGAESLPEFQLPPRTANPQAGSGMSTPTPPTFHPPVNIIPSPTSPTPSHPPQPSPSPLPNPPPTPPSGNSTQYVGNWHAQLGFKKFPELRVDWGWTRPPTKVEGKALLDQVWVKLPPPARLRLDSRYPKIIRFINNGPVPPGVSRSWPHDAGACWHMDLEVNKGSAFTGPPVLPPSNLLIAIIVPPS